MTALTLCMFVTVLCVSLATTIPTTAHFKVYGNWCGAHHGGGPAKDALDRICRTHDKCYDRYGYFNCLCDRNMVNSIKRLTNLKLRVIGAPMAAFFKRNPCKAPVKRPGFCGWKPCLKCSNVYIATRLKMLVNRYMC